MSIRCYICDEEIQQDNADTRYITCGDLCTNALVYLPYGWHESTYFAYVWYQITGQLIPWEDLE